MCGIVGLQGRFSLELLDRMTAAVAHRGPDGEGRLWIETPGAPPAGLGHRRLAIIDLSSAGCQPMSLRPDGAEPNAALTLVYNGEIYNYRELKAELEAAGHRFSTQTDSEVLLHLYQRHGLDALRRLNGIFAFAIHDARAGGRPDGVERGALFLARDQAGVKPLYYASTDDGFLFASEIKALLCHQGISRSIDPLALQQMIAYLWTPAPRTMLSEVRKLEPGCAMIVQQGRVSRYWRYYRLPYDGRRDPRPRAEIAAELHERLEASVRRQLVSDVPVGAFLSGGLDSSAVVAMMRKALPDRRIQCFSIGFADDVGEEGNPADLPYARKVAQHLNVDLEEIRIEASSINRLDEMIELLDEPQADPAPINALFIAERARAMGMPVLLSGAGGDDIFSGYRRHRALQLERWWAWLPSPVRAGLQKAVETAVNRPNGQRSITGRRIAKMFAHAGDDAERRLISYFWWNSDKLRQSLFTRDFSARIQAADPAEPLRASLDEIPQEHDPLQRMLFLETRHFLADHNLNYTDRAGMAVGVEVRVPLLDLELIDFAATIPSAMKQTGAEGKSIFKEAMSSLLPRDVIYRPKSGFGAPLRRWLRGELRDKVEDTLSPASLERRGFFDAKGVRSLIDGDRQGRVDGAYTLFALMCFELWCRRFIDV
ncbi:MAG TPA: asparagine synthase (glutamine-hydrolyzing) [Steroidobacteraceae bacterium]|jgi:asparagine synthase (glutamine-hydrolysing)